MVQVDQIKADIEALPAEEFNRLREWLLEKDWQRWDEQLEKDVAAGKLEFLREEARAAKAQNRLRDL